MCLYRDSDEGAWQPMSCRVLGDGLEFTMYPSGVSFVLREATVTTVGDGPMMEGYPSSRLAVSWGEIRAEMAVPDGLRAWFLTEARHGAE